MTEQVAYISAALRITNKENLIHSIALKTIISIPRTAYKKCVKIHIWASTPGTDGCPWRHVNAALGRETGDVKLSGRLTEHASRICRFAVVCGGHYTWEWPERSSLWQDRRILKLTSVACHFAYISASAVDWFTVVKNKEVTAKKKLKNWTTDDRVAEAFYPYHTDPNHGRKTFVESCGIVARRTAHYTKKFGEIYWESQSSCRASAVSAFAASRLATSPAYLCGGHCELDALPTMRLWCSLITRVVKPKSAEARCEGAAKAIQKGLSNMNSKKVWNTGEVYSLVDIIRNPEIPEAMFGRVFSILRIKN